MTRILRRGDVERLLTMREVVEWMREAFGSISDGVARVPVRGFLDLPDSRDGLLTMPAWQPNPPRYAVKLISLHEKNPAMGLPFAHATVVVIDSSTGELKGIIEGELLTAIRTGAGSGLATDLLARDNAHTVVVVGAGRQAATQLEAVSVVRAIDECHVVTRSRETGERFAAEMADKLGLRIRWIGRDDPRSSDVLRAADVVCTATNSSTPVLSADELSPGVHINGVGSHRPDMAELPADLIVSSRVFVDQREACLKEAGDIMQPIESGLITADDLAGELGEVVLGRVAGRTSDEQRTVFKSVGNGVQDLVTAVRLLEKAERDGAGLEVDLSR
ncbi:MAG: ornithine cyclodeaminase family protein [Bacteroidetes bacterium]|nr:ornithine cyclodeaminase family protein [Bacteroidota bacterium]